MNGSYDVMNGNFLTVDGRRTLCWRWTDNLWCNEWTFFNG